MVNFLSRRFRIVIKLLCMGFTLLLLNSPVGANQLKDIRVGEYDGYTRIVFELDEKFDNPRIKIQAAGQLLITFASTNVNLIRKIPIELSRHVSDIQIWQRKTELSTLLIFNYPHLRFKSFTLSKPVRLGLDVFPASDPPAPLRSKLTEIAVESAGVKSPSPPAQPFAVTKQTPGNNIGENAPPADNSTPNDTIDRADKTARPKKPNQLYTEESLIQLDTSKEKHTKSADENDPSNDAIALPSKKDRLKDSSFKATPPPQSTLIKPRTQENIAAKDASLHENTNISLRNSLQHYLVIILVIITIVILLLLLIMLFTRHRLSKYKTSLNAASANFQQHQEEKTTALDMQINKQLKPKPGD